MSCDYILPPAKADSHNMSSLHGMLTAVLPEWLEFRKNIMRFASKDVQRAAGARENTHQYYMIPKEPPKLLPVTVVGFTATARAGEGTRTNDTGEIVPRGPQYVYSEASSLILAMQDMFLEVRINAAKPDPQRINFAASDEGKWKYEQEVVDLLRAKKVRVRRLLTNKNPYFLVTDCFYIFHLQVLEILKPEIIVYNGVSVPVYAWAAVKDMQAILTHSAKERWPIAWMATRTDKCYFNRLRNKNKPIQTNEQRAALPLLETLTSIVQFIMVAAGPRR